MAFKSVSGGLDRGEADVRVVPHARPLAFRESRWTPWLIALVDLAALEVAVILGFLLRLALTPWFPVSVPSRAFSGMAIGIVVLPAIYALAQLYPGYGLPPVERLRRRVYANVGVFGLLIAWDYLVQDNVWSRGMLLATFVFVLFLTPIAESAVRGVLIRMGRWGLPVVLMGAGATGNKVSQVLRDQPELGFVPVAFLDDDSALWGTAINGIPVLGPLSEIRQMTNDARLPILTMAGVTGKELAELSAELPFTKIIVVPDLIGLQSLWVEPRDLGGVMALEMRNNLLLPYSRRLKRTIDIVLCALLVPLTLPLTALIALAIKLDSRGPVLFVQQRLGVGQRYFPILKFRTMHGDAEANLKDVLAHDPELRREYETFHKLRHDPRVTRVGNFLRKSSLDEIPQLWNVLRGEMSLIGPRPYMPEELPKFKGAESIILQVPPGLTGLWQVRGRTAVTFEDRLEIDIYYIRNWSLWLDLHVLVRTFGAILHGEGEH